MLRPNWLVLLFVALCLVPSVARADLDLVFLIDTTASGSLPRVHAEREEGGGDRACEGRRRGTRDGAHEE